MKVPCPQMDRTHVVPTYGGKNLRCAGELQGQKQVTKQTNDYTSNHHLHHDARFVESRPCDVRSPWNPAHANKRIDAKEYRQGRANQQASSRIAPTKVKYPTATTTNTYCCLPLGWLERIAARSVVLGATVSSIASQNSANLDIMNLSKGTATRLCQTILLATLREAIKRNRSAQPCIRHFDSLVAVFHCRPS